LGKAMLSINAVKVLNTAVVLKELNYAARSTTMSFIKKVIRSAQKQITPVAFRGVSVTEKIFISTLPLSR
jgi:hypothetical protein